MPAPLPLSARETADATSGMRIDPGPSATWVGRQITASMNRSDAISAVRGNAMTAQRHSPCRLIE